MSSCARCGAALLPAATICAACCQPVDASPADVARAVLEAVPAPAEPEPELAPPARAEAVEPFLNTRPPEPDPALVSAGRTAPMGEVVIPNQRSAFFHPVQVATTPPPNPYLAASRRQYEALRESTEPEV